MKNFYIVKGEWLPVQLMRYLRILQIGPGTTHWYGNWYWETLPGFGAYIFYQQFAACREKDNQLIKFTQLVPVRTSETDWILKYSSP